MKKNVLIILLLILSCELSSQVISNRIKLKYKISKSKLRKLNEDSMQITDHNKKPYRFCDQLKRPLKCLITYNLKDSSLVIDPWRITEKGKYQLQKKSGRDSSLLCLCKDSVINAKTRNTLRINFKRRNYIGDPTVPLTLPYQTVILGVNLVGLKIRPPVKDYNDSAYSANAIAGTFNLGISIGYSFGWTKFTHRTANSISITPGIACGFSAVSLAKEPLKNKITTAYTPSNFVLSPAACLTIARNDVGIILSYGRDYMTGRHADDWAYQGKGFFALGIAAGLKL